MLVSKIFNNRHLPSLAASLTGSAQRTDRHYFTLGLPPLSPPIIRGSMLIMLDADFLFQPDIKGWWSPTDIGGLRDGFIGRTNLADLPLAKLPLSTLASFLAAMNSRPAQEAYNWLTYREGAALQAAALSFLPPRLRFPVEASNDPQRFACEIEATGLSIATSSVRGFWCPSTYVELPSIKFLKSVLNKKVNTYDAKFGLESIKDQALAVLDRCVRKSRRGHATDNREPYFGHL